MSDSEINPAAASETSGPKVNWDDSDLRTTYANVVNATSTREEVSVFFGVNKTWNGADGEFDVKLTDRMVLNPYAAKRLALLLAGVLTQYEKRYGKLDLDLGSIARKQDAPAKPAKDLSNGSAA